MLPSNDPWSPRPPLRLAAAIALGAGLLLGAGCGGPDKASLEEDVRLEISHEPPETIPAGEPVLIGLRVSATPPLAPGSAHLWYESDGEWARVPLEPLTGTNRLEAALPAQARGKTVRYYFTVQSPLGKTVRLPEPARSPGFTGTAPTTAYTAVARGPVAPWAAWLRAAGAALALVLVAGGTLQAARARAGRTRGRPGAYAGLAALGLALFGAALVGALAASYQATRNPLGDVPAAWWIALALWAGALLLARGGAGAPPAAARRPGARVLLTIALVLLGALAVLVGFGKLL